MKRIHLIRHAKSSWKNSRLTDINRPLNKRGKRTSDFMAQPLVQAGCCFEQIFCSPAIRAQATIERISREQDQPLQWTTVDQLYTFDSRVLLDWCRALDEAITEPLIIGHNPALTDFCNAVSSTTKSRLNTTIKNIPTCGYVQLTLEEGCSWQELTHGSARLTAFLRPKTLMQ
ncbi:histidine phosphatase family protein [Desulfobulbus sp. TB]|nr:histidine phosphatase family protein [Desulfobulbus sp. TB]